MIYIMSTEAAVLLGIFLLICIAVIACRGAVRGILSGSSGSSLQKISVKSKVSPAGTAKVTEAFYYRNMQKFTAEVSCKALNDTAFLMDDTSRGLERQIEETFAEYDRRVAARRK